MQHHGHGHTRECIHYQQCVFTAQFQLSYTTPRIIDKNVALNAGADLRGRSIDARPNSADYYVELEMRFGSDYAQSIIAQWDMDVWQFLR